MSSEIHALIIESVPKPPWKNNIRVAFYYYEKNGKYYEQQYHFNRNESSRYCGYSQPLNGKTLKEIIDARLDDIKRPDDKITDEIKFIGEPGKYFPRIYRPGLRQSGFHESEIQTINLPALTQAIATTKILLNNLLSLFETVNPDKANFSTYGIKIRNIIFLACTEVESSLSSVLRANGYTTERTWTTKDYIKLLKPMYLNDFKISYLLHPDLNSITPFINWNSEAPTTSLNWYKAYNETKHNREENLEKATLENAIQSVSAAIILLYAQFGPSHNFWKQAEFLNIKFENMPSYKLTDIYIPHSDTHDSPVVSCQWKPMMYNFTAAI
jgi:hypothetical protein